MVHAVSNEGSSRTLDLVGDQTITAAGSLSRRGKTWFLARLR
jgi:hypothetical protein